MKAWMQPRNLNRDKANRRRKRQFREQRRLAGRAARRGHVVIRTVEDKALTAVEAILEKLEGRS